MASTSTGQATTALSAQQQLLHALQVIMRSQQGGQAYTAEEVNKAQRLVLSVQEMMKQGKVDNATFGQITDLLEKMRTVAHPGAVQQAQQQQQQQQPSQPPPAASSSSASTTAAPPAAASPAQPAANSAAVPPAPAVSVAAAISSSVSGLKSTSPMTALTSKTGEEYPISSSLNLFNSSPAQYNDAPGRPTLTGGFASGNGRILSTPAQVVPPQDTASTLASDSARRRKNTPADQSMRRSIQDLVSSIDPNVKIEPDVEDLLLDIADEFIDSVTNFACRLAKHRGGDSLEVRDLQLHLERNHNIRVPGFASDETRISMSQTAVAPIAGAPGGGGSGKKGAQTGNTTLRAQRLAQVAQAKREAKLM
ncbi:hypothetical protein SCHPADRAFT_851278 [Schizopora paradoxa]|uniref:TBP-associated factor 12 n=1 Tax=Schizopora paradoxa TaxID=27342 RepID=A0A0H2RRM8_9AGAM|nr:hypothetical protein SCHPADRAFT_851278 [Schizopora paradoxa]